MLKTLYRKFINALLTVLVFIYLVLEELIWERIAEPIYGFIRELRILQALEAVILRLNPLYRADPFPRFICPC